MGNNIERKQCKHKPAYATLIQYVDRFIISDSIITEHPVEEKKNAEKKIGKHFAHVKPVGVNGAL